MAWQFSAQSPVYLQIAAIIKQKIASGGYNPGERIPAVRDMAFDAAVNPNTMQRALSELERDGLLKSERTSGRYVTDDAGKISELKVALATGCTEQYFDDMGALGYEKRAALEFAEHLMGGKQV